MSWKVFVGIDILIGGSKILYGFMLVFILLCGEGHLGDSILFNNLCY